MTAPAVSAFTDMVLREVPEIHHTLDEPAGWPLRRFVSLLGDLTGPAWTFTMAAASGDLADPSKVPVEWLPWVAFMSGCPTRSAPIDIDPPTVWQHGTAGAIARAVAARLPAGVPVTVTPKWRGNPWIIAVQTPQASTPLTGQTITTFAEWEQTFPTFADAEAETATFAGLASIDRVHLTLAAAGQTEAPAGCRVYHLWSPT